MEVNTLPKQLLFSTVRIQASNNSFRDSSVGTGFIFEKTFNGKSMPFVVTNKHVIGEYESENIGGFKDRAVNKLSPL